MIKILNSIIELISVELDLGLFSIKATWKLLEEGATVPFIARYRKEVTGGLDEVQIMAIRDAVTAGVELEKRREFIIKTIDEQGNLTDFLKKKINSAGSLQKLEDLYLPYKPKRRTKATIAKEKGLEPLANTLFDQKTNQSVEQLAREYVKNEVKSVDEALEGARHIIAERINEDGETRERVRNLFKRTAIIKSKVFKAKLAEGEKFKDYFEWEEPLSKVPSHRLLAMRRGEKESILSLDVSVDSDDALSVIEKQVVKNTNYKDQLDLAIQDSYKRLMKPSIETEFRLLTKKKADEEAINVFSENLKELLMASPLGQKKILAIDPGFRTGCKVVALNAQGKLEEYKTIFPHEPQRKTREAELIIRDLLEKYAIEAIAVGNGTAGRETESFVRKLNLENITIVMVNESGASIYSASEAAREEFPDQDVTVRGSVSIGRRLADPLAELVKIDPKSIGVGQYQHDVDQSALKNKLDEVVMSCVNAVGVDVNTASKELLTYVSGLGPVLAQNIINYRNENGAFKSRSEIKKVARMGAKAFEQAAGFLRVQNEKQPLDITAVHPERYDLVKNIAKDLKATVKDLIELKELRAKIDLKNYISSEVGLPTLQDIINELEKPGRDPRKAFETFSFAEGVNAVEDLQEGMELNGIVTNVTNFGAFVDIGVHQDGLVHISQLADTFVSDPKQVVKVNQQVKVRVVEVDYNRKRIALSMKFGIPQQAKRKPQENKIEEEPSKDMGSALAQLKGKWG